MFHRNTSVTKGLKYLLILTTEGHEAIFASQSERPLQSRTFCFYVKVAYLSYGEYISSDMSYIMIACSNVRYLWLNLRNGNFYIQSVTAVNI